MFSFICSQPCRNRSWPDQLVDVCAFPRLHSIKNMQRKAENQIKMAKMIMMNELTKRANLLIEQLEVSDPSDG